MRRLALIAAICVLAPLGAYAATIVTELHPWQGTITYTEKVGNKNVVKTATVQGTITDLDTYPDPVTVTVTGTTTEPQTSGWLNDLGELGRPARTWDSAGWYSDSQRLVDLLESTATTAILTVGSYGVSEFKASASDPVMTVTNTNGWGNKPSGGSFQCPSAATPATGTDAHMVCVQTDGSFWELWKAVRTSPTTWTAGAVCFADAGTFTHTVPACRGSSFTLASGALLPQEFQSGRITHALAAVLPSAAVRRAYMWPSYDTDGINSDGIPEGARLVLNPNADISGLSGITKILAQAWKDYGFYVVDKTSGSDLSFIAISPQSWTALGQSDPWAAQGITGYPNVSQLLPFLSECRIEDQPVTIKT